MLKKFHLINTEIQDSEIHYQVLNIHSF